MTNFMTSVLVAVIAMSGCGGATTSGGASASGGSAAAAAPSGPSIVVTSEMGSPHVGELAPDFEVSTPEGERVSLASLRGTPVFLTTATSWCPFSRAEQPAIARVAREYAARGVRVVVVNVDETPEGYREYVSRADMGTPVYYAARAEGLTSLIPPRAQETITRDRWKLLISSNLVIDAEGRIRFYTMCDTLHFDSELDGVRAALDDLARPAS